MSKWACYFEICCFPMSFLVSIVNSHGGLRAEVSIELDRNMKGVLYAKTFVVFG